MEQFKSFGDAYIKQCQPLLSAASRSPTSVPARRLQVCIFVLPQSSTLSCSPQGLQGSQLQSEPTCMSGCSASLTHRRPLLPCMLTCVWPAQQLHMELCALASLMAYHQPKVLHAFNACLDSRASTAELLVSLPAARGV